MRQLNVLCLLALAGCPNGVNHTPLSVSNWQDNAVTVFVSFGSDSKITADDWKFCQSDNQSGGLSCSFSMDKKSTKSMPNPEGKYINATFSFGEAVGCGITKAEVNINNPAWYDILDVSLVDGYSNDVVIYAKIDDGKTYTLGPPLGKAGNEKVYGLFPYGCDICVERQDPPCGISKGKDGCKKGTQYDPAVPCQYQGKQKGGGDESVDVILLK